MFINSFVDYMKISNIFKIRTDFNCRIPAFSKPAYAGNPGVADSCLDEIVDINEILIDHPADTFFSKIEAEYEFAGISDGDIAIIDSAIEPKDGDIVCVSSGDGLEVREYICNTAGQFLKSENGEIRELEGEDSIKPGMIVGVISKVIHTF